MNHGITLRGLRTSALVVAGSGALCSLVFALILYGSLPSLFLEDITCTLLPYIVVAVAARLSPVRTLVVVALLAALSVLVLESYTFIDLALSPYFSINDIELVTEPLEWCVSLLALVAAFIGFLWRIIHDRATGR